MSSKANLHSGKRINTHQDEDQVTLDLKSGRRINSEEQPVEINEKEVIDENTEVNIDPVFKVKTKRFGLKALFFISLFILVLVESVISIQEAISYSWFLGGVYLFVLGSASILLIKLFSRLKL